LRERVGFLKRLITEARLARVRRWFDSYGSFTIFMGRQLAGVRFVTFFTAGTMRVPLGRFVLFDFLGCLVSVPVWLTLGAFASRYGREWLEVAMRKVGGGLFLGSLLAFIVFVIIVRVRSAARAKTAAAPLPTQDLP
jgi:membrane protein DedA with SNARE-associated domain